MASTTAVPSAKKVASPEQILAARELLDEIYVDEKVLGYVVDLVFATRNPAEAGLEALKPLILYGASPRASIALVQAARARAFLEGRGYVTPHDVKAVGLEVLRHRVITTYEAEAEGVELRGRDPRRVRHRAGALTATAWCTPRTRDWRSSSRRSAASRSRRAAW